MVSSDWQFVAFQAGATTKAIESADGSKIELPYKLKQMYSYK